MASNLWADSLRASMLLGLGFARRLSMKRKKSMVTLDGVKKILGAHGKVGSWQGDSQWSMVAYDVVCAGGSNWTRC
ncbi:hypothetical protein CsSME_00002731 [Camellia sinensis var. sinensis]